MPIWLEKASEKICSLSLEINKMSRAMSEVRDLRKDWLKSHFMEQMERISDELYDEYEVLREKGLNFVDPEKFDQWVKNKLNTLADRTDRGLPTNRCAEPNCHGYVKNVGDFCRKAHKGQPRPVAAKARGD
jgi:hypothetical protein